ncbi:uncharacterized protein LOC143242602 [Tachypleus tridentatus]|uniref:uncharacterized protein LOC143242379 n=1 Tax=Tachypleus tridentatus TaxID=6853 RepID=UPI003FD0AE79
MYLITLFITTFINACACDDDAILFPDSVDISGNPSTFNGLKIPESLLIKMSTAKNFTQFVNEFLIDVPYIFERRKDVSVPATPATCEPYLDIVELPKSSDPLLVSWPPCTRLKRCSGCATSSLLTCVPTKTKTVSLKVVKAKYSEAASGKFSFMKQETIKMEEHEKCSFKCRVKATDCNNQQNYNEDECRCVCKNHHMSGSCHKDQIWDSDVCECKCRNYSECSTGLYFNTRTCRCEASSF